MKTKADLEKLSAIIQYVDQIFTFILEAPV